MMCPEKGILYAEHSTPSTEKSVCRLAGPTEFFPVLTNFTLAWHPIGKFEDRFTYGQEHKEVFVFRITASYGKCKTMTVFQHER